MKKGINTREFGKMESFTKTQKYITVPVILMRENFRTIKSMDLVSILQDRES